MAPLLRKYYVNLDSSLRDRDVYSRPDQYQFRLDEPIYGVSNIKVAFASIPNSEYLLNQDNRYLDFKVGATTYTAELGNAAYFNSEGNGGLNVDPVELAAEIKNAVDVAASGIAPVFSNITLDFNTSKFTFEADSGITDDIEFLFGTGPNKDQSAARLLGFHDDTDYTYTYVFPNVTTFKSPGLIQLNGLREVLLVLSDGVDKFTQIKAPSSEVQYNVTGRFPMDVQQGFFYTYRSGSHDFPIEYKFYEGDKFSLGEIRVELYKSRGDKLQRVNFNGVNNIIQLEITAYTDRMMINNTYAKDKRLGLPKPVDIPLNEPVDRFTKNQQLIIYISATILILGLLYILLRPSRHTQPRASSSS